MEAYYKALLVLSLRVPEELYNAPEGKFSHNNCMGRD